jgi:glycosyltransferase involved in cell wall biosynthesis
MYHDMVIAAVVPAYKEREHIARVITSMPDFVDHIVVVDDCSPDDTAEVARKTRDPRLTVVRREKNGGVGAAIVTGHRTARELGAHVNVVMAGDGQMDPAYLETLLDPVVRRGYAFAKANRFFSMRSFEGMPRLRVFGSVVLSFATKAASGYWHLFDPQNGYTAIHHEALDRLDLDRLAGGYSFENDLLIQLNVLRVPAIDVPIPAVYGTEVSGIKLHKVVPELLRLLVVGFWKRFFQKYVLWSFSPIALFMFAGLGLLLVSLVTGSWVVAHTLGPPVATTGSVLLAVTPFLLGVQLVLYALLLDIQESPDEPVTAAGLPAEWTGRHLHLRAEQRRSAS